MTNSEEGVQIVKEGVQYGITVVPNSYRGGC